MLAFYPLWPTRLPKTDGLIEDFLVMCHATTVARPTARRADPDRGELGSRMTA